MAETIAVKMKHDRCLIYSYRADLHLFSLEASSGKDESPQYSHLPESDLLAQEVLRTLSPMIMPDISGYPVTTMSLRAEFVSVAAIPVVRDNACAGMLLLAERTPWVFNKDGPGQYPGHPLPYHRFCGAKCGTLYGHQKAASETDGPL